MYTIELLLIERLGISGGPVAWQDNSIEIFTRFFQIMVIGPVLVTQHFEESLVLGKAAKIVNISSKLGSVSGENKI